MSYSRLFRASCRADAWLADTQSRRQPFVVLPTPLLVTPHIVRSMAN